MGMFDEVLENVGKPYEGGGKGFEYGTHEVVIGVVEPKQKKTKNDPNAEVIVITVYDEKDEDRTAEATLYFHTEGGARMSVTKVLGLLVHKSGEEKKDAVRALGKKLFDQIDDPTVARDVAAKLIAEKLVGAKAFLFVDPQGKYKTSSYGDIWHYAYEDPNADDRAEAVAKDIVESGTPLTEEETAEIPGFEDL
jgi:hypothetical protein